MILFKLAFTALRRSHGEEGEQHGPSQHATGPGREAREQWRAGSSPTLKNRQTITFGMSPFYEQSFIGILVPPITIPIQDC